MRRIAVLSALVCVTACQEPFVAPPPFSPGLSSRELWSGGELRLTEALFANANAVVLLGNDTLLSRRIDDTTVSVRLPRYPGTFPVRVIAGRSTALLGDVTLHGFESARRGAFMSGQPYWLPGGGAPLVFSGANEGAAVFDLRTDTPVLSIPDSISSPDCIFSPSPTYRTNRFVLLGKKPDGTCGFPKVWTLEQPPRLIDSIPCCSFDWYTSGQPSPRRWIFNRNNHNEFFACDSVCVNTSFFSGDGPDGVTISPRGDRFMWLPAWRPVVFDGRTLDTAFVIAGGFLSLTGAFSFEGDTLALTGDDSTPARHIFAVRSSDGAFLHDITVDSIMSLSPGRAMGVDEVAFDPINPWLYVAAYSYQPGDSVTHQHLIVLNRASWTVLGVLDAGEPHLGRYPAVAIVPSPVEHRVYVVSAVNGEDMHGFRAIIYQYTTP